MAAVFSTVSIMTKNMNGLNNLIKKQDPTHAVYKKHIRLKNTNRFRVKARKKAYIM